MRETSDGTASGLDYDKLRRDTLAAIPEWAKENVILMGVRGSHAHGTYIPPEHEYGTDDVDVFVVTAQPADWYLGLAGFNPQRKEGQHFETSGSDLDVVVYDVRKFGYLLMKGNPNVHNWLWSPNDCYLLQTEASDAILERRGVFLSQRALQSTAGYASAQLHKMDHFQRNGYMGRKRKELVSRHGYDVKNAAHCVRLLLQGIGLARTGRVQVRWKHHQLAMLKEIKQGKWTLDKVRDYAEHLFDMFNAARSATTRFPDRPDENECSAVIANAIRIASARRNPDSAT